MAKKKSEKTEDKDNLGFPEAFMTKYGKIVENGEKVLQDLLELKVISLSPALDLALGGGLREGSLVVMTGDPKSGKDQPLTSTIYTPDGPVKMGSIKIGDVVCTPDGGSAEVKGVFPQGIKDVYRITFNDGSFAECGINHLWKVCKNYHGRDDKWVVLSLKEIIEEGLFYSDRPKWKIPLSQPVNFKKQDLEIDPYILGCLLGDGGLSQGTPKITSADNEILEAFKVYAQNNNLSINHISRYDYSISGHGNKINSLTSKLRSINLMGKNSHSKFIPSNYIYSSIDDRFELIKGLMDTDGYNDHGKTAEYTTVSYALSIHVKEILQSLGYTVKTKERITKCNGKEFPSFRLHISGNDVNKIFKLSRKIFLHKRTKPELFRTIRKVELVRQEETQCVFIDHPDHLYLTDNFVVTHNTTTSLYFAAKCQKLGKTVMYFNTEGRITKENFIGIKGLDPAKISIVQATEEQPIVSAETFLNSLEYCVKNIPDLVCIIDSASNMVPQEELDGEIRTGVRNALPRLLSMFCKRISGDVARNKAILIFITHNIANTNPTSRYSPQKHADCGNMIQYQAGTNMIITHRGKWEVPAESGNHVGQIANWNIKTSAAGGKPNSTAESWIRYGVGIDETQEIIHLAVQLALIKVKGAWYELTFLAKKTGVNPATELLLANNIDTTDEETVTKFFKFQGIQKVNDFLNENPQLITMISDEIKSIL